MSVLVASEKPDFLDGKEFVVGEPLHFVHVCVVARVYLPYDSILCSIQFDDAIGQREGR